MRRLLVYQIILRCISVNLETLLVYQVFSVNLRLLCLSKRKLILRRLLVYQLVLRNISVNVETSIGLSISFKIYSVNLKTSIGLSISFKKY